MKKVNQIWFNVYSEMYGETKACVIDIEHTIKTGKCDCGDGESYTLTRHEIEQLKKGLKSEQDFIPSSKLEYPLNIIALLVPSENRMSIPQTFQLKKKEYADLKKEILKAGGKYRKNGFDFKEPANKVYDRIISGDNYNLKKKFQFFATPLSLAYDICLDTLDPYLNKKVKILEPSAGHGAIISSIQKWIQEEAVILEVEEITAIEFMELNMDVLRSKYSTNDVIKLIEGDFLKVDLPNNSFDFIIANPPFSNGQDIKHLQRMYDLCKPGGVITSVMSTGWIYNTTKKYQDFRKWLGMESRQDVNVLKVKISPDSISNHCLTRTSKNGFDEVIKITSYPEGTFKESGTNVITCVIQITKRP